LLLRQINYRQPGNLIPEASGRSLVRRHRVSKIDFQGGEQMHQLFKLWRDDEGQDIAEYAVMLAVILVIVVGTIRLIGSNANNVFSNVASSIQCPEVGSGRRTGSPLWAFFCE